MNLATAAGGMQGIVRLNPTRPSMSLETVVLTVCGIQSSMRCSPKQHEQVPLTGGQHRNHTPTT